MRIQVKSVAFALAALIASPAAIAVNEAALETCRGKLKQAQKLDVLQGLEWGKSELKVVAGPTYYRMSYQAKEGFAETVSCFGKAGDSGCLNFDITHWQTGRATDRYSRCKLSPK